MSTENNQGSSRCTSQRFLSARNANKPQADWMSFLGLNIRAAHAAPNSLSQSAFNAQCKVRTSKQIYLRASNAVFAWFWEQCKERRERLAAECKYSADAGFGPKSRRSRNSINQRQGRRDVFSLALCSVHHYFTGSIICILMRQRRQPPWEHH